MMQVRLRMVVTCDFRRSELTNFLDNRLVPKKIRDDMGPRDVVVLKPTSGTQVVFVFRPVEVTREKDGAALPVLPSLRLRLPLNRSWDPAMLAEYAGEVGLEIKGAKTLKQQLTERRLK